MPKTEKVDGIANKPLPMCCLHPSHFNVSTTVFLARVVWRLSCVPAFPPFQSVSPMPTFLISYDLANPQTNKHALAQAVMMLGTTWARPLAQMWYIRSSLAIKDIETVLSALLGEDDGLVVQGVERDAVLANTTLRWFKQRRPEAMPGPAATDMRGEVGAASCDRTPRSYAAHRDVNSRAMAQMAHATSLGPVTPLSPGKSLDMDGPTIPADSPRTVVTFPGTSVQNAAFPNVPFATFDKHLPPPLPACS